VNKRSLLVQRMQARKFTSSLRIGIESAFVCSCMRQGHLCVHERGESLLVQEYIPCSLQSALKRYLFMNSGKGNLFMNAVTRNVYVCELVQGSFGFSRVWVREICLFMKRIREICLCTTTGKGNSFP
jgi:hypothetical protein